MAIYDWPTDIRIATFDAEIEFDVQFNVMRSGSVTTYGLPGARWACTITFPNELEHMQRPRVEALIASLEGGANRLRMHHWGRPTPNGTMRGTPTVNASAPQGSKFVQITNANGTLKRGDIIGILGQNLKVIADVSPVGGVMTVNFVGPLRNAVTPGTAVTWSRPQILWMPKSNIAGPFPYLQNGLRPGFACQFIEVY